MNTDLSVLARDLKAKAEALNAQTSDAELTVRIKAALASVLTEPEFVRKIRFGGDTRLANTKFRGLSIAGVEFLAQLIEAAHAVRPVNVKAPSEELRNVMEHLSKAEFRSVASIEAAERHQLEEMFGVGQLTSAQFTRALQSHDANYRAMDTAETGYGLQLIGAQYSPELWAGARLESLIFAQIPTFPMTAPTAYLPAEADMPEVLFVAENTASNSSNYTTSKAGSNRVQVDAKKFLAHLMWSGEMDEDAIIPFIPFLMRQATIAFGYYLDSAVVNGDTTNAATGNINLDDADPADTKHYLAFDGIRHAALVDNTNNVDNINGAVVLDDLSLIRGKLLDSTYKFDWGHPRDKEDLLFVGDPETADAISVLPEVLTVDKFGPLATVLTGQVARVLGHPLISSMAVSKTEADGKVSTTGSNNTKGQLVTFNRRGFQVGILRDTKTAGEYLPATDQWRMVLSQRCGFGRFSPTGSASGIEAAGVSYNITLPS